MSDVGGVHPRWMHPAVLMTHGMFAECPLALGLIIEALGLRSWIRPSWMCLGGVCSVQVEWILSQSGLGFVRANIWLILRLQSPRLTCQIEPILTVGWPSVVLPH